MLGEAISTSDTTIEVFFRDILFFSWPQHCRGNDIVQVSLLLKSEVKQYKKPNRKVK
jgi:hypothetical protein